MSLPRATQVGPGESATDQITLDYAARIVRRKRLTSDAGVSFLVDFDHATHLDPGQAFVLDTGASVAIVAAAETLLRIRGNLPRLAWHIGNRHTPCAMAPDHLTILFDPVLRDMLVQLGAEVEEVTGPFTPEGGAYGHGRTMGHSHDHDHSHDH
ncbi:MAG: urease accessory protein UreE [Pseudomonadota bacterium]